MSDFPFSIPRRGDADVVNGVSYAGTTLTLTRAEGSDLTTTIPTAATTNPFNHIQTAANDVINVVVAVPKIVPVLVKVRPFGGGILGLTE